MASLSPSELVHVFFHEGMLNHNIGTGVFDTLNNPGFLEILDKHPENPDRVKNMVSILKRHPISPHMAWHQGRPAQTLELLSFHTPGTILNPSSWDVVLIAASTTLSAMKHIIDGHGKIAYSSVRPPGHHAQPTRADGYCFINNAGLEVQLASDSCCERVAVIDIDVHYGNGTAEGFYRTNKVLTISFHMNHGSWGPSYLQSGTVDELGEREGYGFNLNVMLPNGTGD
ncbi:hypothetical protein Sjap_012501 [Stephania japonica]|uniref:Histone deacetylase domain-containing protein n=1 Tax=Stephania japonica TaxID=461633 RepID=A0AAP0IW72_9MAGN